MFSFCLFSYVTCYISFLLLLLYLRFVEFNEMNTTFNQSDHNYYSNKDLSLLPSTNVLHKNGNEIDKHTWQTVPTRNKRQNCDNQNGVIKKSNLGQCQNKNNLEVSNSYEVLGIENAMDDDASIQNRPKEKIPPIFVPDISNIKSMINSIETVISKDDYTYKCTNDKVKITTVTIDAYRTLIKHLTNIKVSFHSFQIKKDRAYRVVIKNLHYSHDTVDIKTAIEAYGHKVRNVSNLRSSKSKNPLNLFFIDLEPASNNKDVYNIEFLLNAKIVVEPPRKVTDIVQCKKCQRYGHTKSYCWYPSRCVKCSLDHETSECKKTFETPPKCVLCNGEHPANYKGCSIYKVIKNKSFPPLRPKPSIRNSMPTETTQNDLPSDIFPQLSDNQSSQPGTSRKSYANAVKTQEISSVTDTITEFFTKFEKLMAQQAQQIGALISLLTTVITKLK